MSTPLTARVRRSARRVATARAARAYVAGPSLDDALAVIATAAERGITATIGCWTPGETPPDVVAARHQEMLAAVARHAPTTTVAIKSRALAGRCDLIDGVTAAAAATGTAICFDAHDLLDAPMTLAGAYRADPDQTVAVALPSRWRRSPEDAERAIATGLGVRLIKGQWADPAAPELDPAAGMLRLAERLRGATRTVGVASHDGPLVRRVLLQLLGTDVPCELELLLGLPLREPARIAAELGVGVRLYVPYGTADTPYPASDARHDRAIARRLLADAVRGRPRDRRTLAAR